MALNFNIFLKALTGRELLEAALCLLFEFHKIRFKGDFNAMKGAQLRQAKNASIRAGLILLTISLMISFVTADMPDSFFQAREL